MISNKLKGTRNRTLVANNLSFRASEGIKETIFTIYTAEQNVTLSPGPLVRVNAGNVDLTSVYHSPSEDDYFYIIRHDIEIQTMLDDERFVPIVTVFLPKNVTVNKKISLGNHLI